MELHITYYILHTIYDIHNSSKLEANIQFSNFKRVTVTFIYVFIYIYLPVSVINFNIRVTTFLISYVIF